VFLILYGVLLKPLPFPDPAQLVRIERGYSGGITVPAYSGTKALFIERASHAFTAMAAYDYVPSHANLVQGDGAVPISVLRVTSDFFRVFDMEPAMGRGFRIGDMVPNTPGVVVLSALQDSTPGSITLKCQSSLQHTRHLRQSSVWRRCGRENREANRRVRTGT
jgi:hypothetical protein